MHINIVLGTDWRDTPRTPRELADSVDGAARFDTILSQAATDDMATWCCHLSADAAQYTKSAFIVSSNILDMTPIRPAWLVDGAGCLPADRECLNTITPPGIDCHL